MCACLLGCPPLNLAPEAYDQSVTAAFDTPTPITLTADDPDDGPLALTYSIVSPPQHGDLTGVPPSVTYTMDAGYTGPDSFTFKAHDGEADSNIATVWIVVQPDGNNCPTCVTNPYKKYRGTFMLTWRWDVPGGVTISGDAQGTVEFGNPVDIGELGPYAPGVAYGVIRANSPAEVRDYDSNYPNGTTCAAPGPGTADVSWGWLYVRNSPDEYAIELNVNVIDTFIETCRLPDPPGGETTSDVRPGLSFGGGGCPLEFVSWSSDVQHLQGSASKVCTTAAGDFVETLTVDLTGY